MARFARVVVTGYPYHVTHRGDWRENVFAEPQDRDCYLALLQEYSVRYGLDVCSYYPMTNRIRWVSRKSVTIDYKLQYMSRP